MLRDYSTPEYKKKKVKEKEKEADKPTQVRKKSLTEDGWRYLSSHLGTVFVVQLVCVSLRRWYKGCYAQLHCEEIHRQMEWEQADTSEKG